MLSGRLGRRSGRGNAKGLPELGDTSSNRSKTTVFGSLLVVPRPSEEERPSKLPCDCKLMRRLAGDAIAAYSGSSEKLSGVTTTPKVPGRCVSAFRSRSSSVCSTENAGMSSYLGMGLLLGEGRARASTEGQYEYVSVSATLLTIPDRVPLRCYICIS